MKKVLLAAVLASGAVVCSGRDINVSAASSNVKCAKKEAQNKVDVNTPKTVEKSAKPAAAVVTAVKSNTIEYLVPCLTVRNDGSHGKISYLPLKFTRTKENKPLRVMIADDTPNGSGNTIHNSVWQAAVTAAMLRNDTMHGTTITVEFSGLVDGPSAGGVTCLAILSAMDGLALPNDFAMTGTILPDGTIGVVGGVPEKMRAAAKAGKKRIFIPAFLRFEKDEKGKNIDLQRLAKELKVKLYRVENIAEAYAVLHGKKYSNSEYVNVREMTRLPQATEDVLMAAYKKYLEKVKAEIKAQPKLAQEFVLPGYVLSSIPAEMLLEEGRIYPATLQIIRTWKAWQAYKANKKFLDDFYKKHNPEWEKIQYLREYHLRKLLFTFRDVCEKYEKTSGEKYQKDDEAYIKKLCGDKKLEGFFPFKSGQSEFTAQVEPVDEIGKILGEQQLLSAVRADKKDIDSADMKTLDMYLNRECQALEILHLSLLPRGEYEEFLTELAGTLPNLKANKRAAEVERLFFSAAAAAGFVAVDNVGFCMQVAKDKKRAAENLKWDPYYHHAVQMQYFSGNCHNQLKLDADKPASNPEYHLQASLKAQISAFCMSSAVSLLYGPDGTNDFIPHMIRNARRAAIRNINECVKANIPCIAAICDFEVAESKSGNKSEQIDVLKAYWRASLYSKALLMSFK